MGGPKLNGLDRPRCYEMQMQKEGAQILAYWVRYKPWGKSPTVTIWLTKKTTQKKKTKKKLLLKKTKELTQFGVFFLSLSVCVTAAVWSLDYEKLQMLGLCGTNGGSEIGTYSENTQRRNELPVTIPFFLRILFSLPDQMPVIVLRPKFSPWCLHSNVNWNFFLTVSEYIFH